MLIEPSFTPQGEWLPAKTVLENKDSINAMKIFFIFPPFIIL